MIFMFIYMFIYVSPLGRSPHLENGLVGVSDTLQGVEIQVFRQTWLGVHLVIWTLRSVHHLAYLSCLPSMIIDACVGNIVTFYVIDEQIHLASGAVLMLCSLLSMYIKLLFAFLGPQETLKTPRSDGDSMYYQ